MAITTVSPPALTVTINQQFFVEAQTGAKQPLSYLDKFPNALYSKSLNSVLIAFLYGLLGPAGAGGLRQDALEARLMLEEAGFSLANLDALYTNPFGFTRLADETYDLDAGASLLNSQDEASILAMDASFRNRCTLFLKGIRAGGTPLGVSLVAESGLNHPVDVFENYKALYDQFADIPLGLPYKGRTKSLNEIIVLPRQEVPRNTIQTLSITGEPTSGWFTLSFPMGADYEVVPVTKSTGSNIITVPHNPQLFPGAYISTTGTPTSTAFANQAPTKFGVIDQLLSPTSVSVVYAPGEVSAGQPLNFTTTGTFWAYLGNGQSPRLPYNASDDQILTALIGIPLLGNNVSVTGGPLPDSPIQVTFIGDMGDIDVPTLEFNIAPDVPLGIGTIGASIAQLADVSSNALADSNGVVTVSQSGVGADSQDYAISPINEHAMQLAVDQIRPITSFVTTGPGQNRKRRQPPQQITADQSSVRVLRFEKGKRKIPWPARDKIHWIEGGVEHEAPRPYNTKQPNYIGYHNVNNIIAYTEDALGAHDYENPDPTFPPLWARFWNTQIGLFNPGQQTLYPFLAQEKDPKRHHNPEHALASSPEFLVVTNTIKGTGIINWEYPVDYLKLPNVPKISTKQHFWASQERITGTDYLELDLGAPQAVNHITFEASKKPYGISLDYDVLDSSPARHFVPVTVVDSTIAKSTLSLHYEAGSTNPWETCTITFTNRMSRMIYARFIRLGFSKTPGDTPLVLGTQHGLGETSGGPRIIPYSIEVRNLRIGRIAHAQPPDIIVDTPVSTASSNTDNFILTTGIIT